MFLMLVFYVCVFLYAASCVINDDDDDDDDDDTNSYESVSDVVQKCDPHTR